MPGVCALRVAAKTSKNAPTAMPERNPTNLENMMMLLLTMNESMGSDCPCTDGPTSTGVRQSVPCLFVQPMDQEQDVEGERYESSGPRCCAAVAGSIRGGATSRRGTQELNRIRLGAEHGEIGVDRRWLQPRLQTGPLGGDHLAQLAAATRAFHPENDPGVSGKGRLARQGRPA